jgi:hypothetical protein
MSTSDSSVLFPADSGVFDLIRTFLDRCDNSSNLPYSDSNLIASFVQALGYLRLTSPRALAVIFGLIERRLSMEEIDPSPHHVIASACLG